MSYRMNKYIYNQKYTQGKMSGVYNKDIILIKKYIYVKYIYSVYI